MEIFPLLSSVALLDASSIATTFARTIVRLTRSWVDNRLISAPSCSLSIQVAFSVFARLRNGLFFLFHVRPVGVSWFLLQCSWFCNFEASVSFILNVPLGNRQDMSFSNLIFDITMLTISRVPLALIVARSHWHHFVLPALICGLASLSFDDTPRSAQHDHFFSYSDESGLSCIPVVLFSTLRG